MKGQVSEEGMGSGAQVSDLNGRVHSSENTGGGAGCGGGGGRDGNGRDAGLGS